jgi:prephenate dehydratase
MIRIAALGPQGTFTELAARRYMAEKRIEGELLFYPTIGRTFQAIGRECDLGLIPIENALDGFVEPSLDLLLQGDFHIIHELVVPIEFVFVGNAPRLEEIATVYVQFKARGQCVQFLERLANIRFVTTESNGLSLEQVRKGIFGEGAIVPKYALTADDRFAVTVEGVDDYENNRTRFLVLATVPTAYEPGACFKTSIAVVDVADEPGALAKILNELADRRINLASIVSRPTKREIGKYHFFLDLEGHYPADPSVKAAIDRIAVKNTVKVLGSYPAAPPI